MSLRPLATAGVLSSTALSVLSFAADAPPSKPKEQTVVMEKVVVEESTDTASNAYSEKAAVETVGEVVVSTDLQKATAQTSTDLLKNTSGVTVNASGSGSSSVSVRGIDQRMLRITVDGQRQGGTGNALDSIPPEIVQSLEVTKTFTPDMDADAVGGVININTGGTVAKANSAQGRHQFTYNSLEPRVGVRESLSLVRLFHFFSPKPNASFMATATFEDQYKARERLSVLREWTPQVSPGPSPYLGETLPVLTQPLIEFAREHRQRSGLLFNADANLGHTAVYLRSNLSRDWTKRNRDLDDTDPASGQLLALTPYFSDFSGVSLSRRNQQQVAVRDAGNLLLGFKSTVDHTELDGMVSLATTRESEPDTLESVFVSTPTYRVQTLLTPDPYHPFFTYENPTRPVSSLTPSDFRFSYLSDSRVLNEDSESTAKLNAKVPLHVTTGDAFVKFGAKAQQRFRAANTDRLIWRNSAQSRDLTGLVGTEEAQLQTMDYTFRLLPDSGAVSRLAERAPQWFSAQDTQTAINSNSGDYRVTESVWAAYLMGRYRRGAWTFLSGLRTEGTVVHSTARQMLFSPTTGDFLGFQTARATNRYTDLLPGLHVRYDANAASIWRASITRSLSRPAYADVVPYRTLSFVDHRSRIGTPDLKPYQATNFDLSFDHYEEKWGLLSTAIFYKKIDHFITDAQYPIEIGNLGRFIEFKRINGSAALAYGAEISWQSPSKTLPHGAGKASLEVNYSYNHGEARHEGRDGEIFPLPRQVDHQASLKVHEELGKFALDVGLRYRTGWWEDLIAQGLDNYIEPLWDAELSANYKLNKVARLSLGINNLLNQPLRHYAGARQRLNDTQISGIDYNVGLQWKI